MDDLVRWLTACLDEDELWATEASRRDDGPVHEGGVHWQWVEPETSAPVVPDPSRDELLTDDAGNFQFGLWSVEEFPTKFVGPLPSFAIPSAEEVPASVAGHIIRHDPARVLREIDAKRRIIAQCVYWNERAAQEAVDPPKYPQPGLDLGLLLDAMNPVLRLLALPYADRPGYRAEWAPTE